MPYSTLRRATSHDEFRSDDNPKARSHEQLAADDQLARNVREALAKAGIGSHPIHVSTLDGLVILTGEVADRLTKYQIETTAAGVPGVTDVDNLLKLRPPTGS